MRHVLSDISSIEIFCKRDAGLAGVAKTGPVDIKGPVVKVVFVRIQDLYGTIDGGRDAIGIRKRER
jgi:hypothetical protein